MRRALTRSLAAALLLLPLAARAQQYNPPFSGGGGGSLTSAMFDALFGPTQGYIIYRNATTWVALPPGTSGQLLASGGAGANPSWITASGTGTVTSVGLALPSIFTVSGSPVTGSGTLTGTLATETANTIFAGPSSGAAAAPTFRALVGADLPAPSATTLGGVEALAAAAHEFLTSISTAGAPVAAQPACGDLSNAAASCSTDATDASNITSGTLGTAEGGTGATSLAGASIPVQTGTITTGDCVKWASGTSIADAGAACGAGAGTITGVTAGTGLTGGGTSGNVTVSLATPVSAADGGTGTGTAPSDGQLLIGNGTGYSLATLTAGANVTITNSAGGITIAASGGGSVTWPTAGDIVVSNATSSPAGIAPVNGDCVVGVSGSWAAGACSGTASATVRGAIGGYLLSNDATNPNTVLDIASGQAADSTAATYITTSATFYGSTGGVWTAGAGTSAAPVNKMGTGLTLAASTWYHVFAIINAGAADVYFDTSVTAANAPTGTTAFRRVGSFKTNASSQIIAFTEQINGGVADFMWASGALLDFSADLGTAARTLITLNVPTGLSVAPLGRFENPNNAQNVVITSPDLEPDQAAPTSYSGVPGFDFNTTNFVVQMAGQFWTNTSGQIGARSTVSTDNVNVFTRGWRDPRGVGQ